MRSHTLRCGIIYGLMALCFFSVFTADAISDRDSLRKSVHADCMRAHPDLTKCLVQNEDYVIYKTRSEPHHYLLVPFADIPGIESPSVWKSGFPAWVALAWNFRDVTASHLGTHGVKTNDIGIAINSKYERTQDQLHIHMNCIKPDVVKMLTSIPPEITEKSFIWSGVKYHMIRFPDASLPDDVLSRFNVTRDFDKQAFFAAYINNSVMVLRTAYSAKYPHSGFAEYLLTNCQ